jgi:hypothetical protein
MKQQTMNPTIVVLVVALLSWWIGCEDTTESPADEPNGEEYVNPNAPNANGLIIHQRLIGDADEQSALWEIIDSGDGGFYFRGLYQDHFGLGKLDQTGQPIWTSRSGYSVDDIIRMSDLSGDLGNSVLTVGGFDSDFDDDDDIGYVSLFSSTGTLIDELVLSNDTADVWLNAVAVSEPSGDSYRCIAVGGTEIDRVLYPYIVRFTVSSDSTVRKTEEKVLADRPENSLRNIQIDRGQTPDVYYMQGDEYSMDTGYGDQFVCRLSDDLHISWGQDVVPQAGFASWSYDGKGFLRSGDDLIMTCVTEVDKETNPTSGGFWDAGVVARLSTGGSVAWVKTIILSQYTERFYSCRLSDGVLYVAGRHSSFLKTASRDMLGNALLLKVDSETGDVLSAMSFGNEYYHSQFNDVLIRGTQAFAVGYTKYEVENGPYQGWFVVIDVSGSPMVPQLRGPEIDRVRAGEAGDPAEDRNSAGVF